MGAHAAELKAMLAIGWTTDELNQRVTATPLILAQKPSTVVSDIRKLQAHSVSSTQALNVFVSFPSIAGYDWSSSANKEKLTYLRHVLQLSQAELASRPKLLGTSLAGKIAPCSDFYMPARVSVQIQVLKS